MFVKPFADRRNSTLVYIRRWVGSVEDPLTDIPTKLLKEGFDVPPRHAAAYGTRDDQLKGALEVPLQSSMVLRLGTRWGGLSTACCKRTLPLSGRQGAWGGAVEG